MSVLEVRDQWVRDWERARAVWSPYLKIREPLWCMNGAEAEAAGLTGSFAMIRYRDQQVVIDLEHIVNEGLQDYGVEILAHELGHHVVAAATTTDHLRCLARMRRALPTVERAAPTVANLYCDLIINDRLFRNNQLRMDEVWIRLHAKGDKDEQESQNSQATRPAQGKRRRNKQSDTTEPAEPGESPDADELWTLYMRIYEHLWQVPAGTYGSGPTTDAIEGDAWLGARLIRAYSHRWLDGSGRFASLLLPYVVRGQRESHGVPLVWLDTLGAAAGSDPMGVISVDPGELDGTIHPALDPELNPHAARATAAQALSESQRNTASRGQTRTPFEFGELLRAAGIDLDDHEAAVRFYREAALPYLVPFPVRQQPQALDPLPEGIEPWETGDPLDQIDWLQTVLQSPRVIPGMTTVQRTWGVSPGSESTTTPVDLDLYVDCSGSMPNPQIEISYPTLAGAVMALSAMRAGASVQCTLWSSKWQVETTDGFVRDERKILRVLTGYFGSGTQFPLHIMRDTYERQRAKPTHIVHISDDGISTMYDNDEQGTAGEQLAARALQHGGAGGTMALLLWGNWQEPVEPPNVNWLVYARDVQGWDLHQVGSLEDLLAFARSFVRRHYVRDGSDGVSGSPRQGAFPMNLGTLG
jgi:hypothetical protein